MDECFVPPRNGARQGWKAIAAHAPHPVMQWFAKIAWSRNVSIRSLAIAIGRDRKNLRETFLASNPKASTMEQIGVALGIPRNYVVGRITGSLDLKVLKGDLSTAIGARILAAKTAAESTSIVVNALAESLALFAEAMGCDLPASEVESATEDLRVLAQTIIKLQCSLLNANFEALASAEAVADSARARLNRVNAKK